MGKVLHLFIPARLGSLSAREVQGKGVAWNHTVPAVPGGPP